MNPSLQVVDDGIKWNVDNIHNKYLISVLHLLVALARHYGIPRRLPSFVKIQVLQITVSIFIREYWNLETVPAIECV